MILSLLKQLKKRWQLRRRWLSLGAIVLLIAIVSLTLALGTDRAMIAPTNNAMATLSQAQFAGLPIEEIRDNSYFGLDEHGVLSLFEGPPLQDKVIRSFFQINIEYLESSLPPETVEQLYKGIQVTNLSEYNSVLSTFSDYAIEISEEVMKSIR